jgi:hypothetical protein
MAVWNDSWIWPASWQGQVILPCSSKGGGPLYCNVANLCSAYAELITLMDNPASKMAESLGGEGGHPLA